MTKKKFSELEKRMKPERLAQAKARAKEIMVHLPKGDRRLSQFDD